MRTVFAACIAVSLLAWPGALAAHHSLVQFDTTTPVWLKGSVVRFERVNPHSRILLDQQVEDGRVQRWAVEGPAPNALARMGIDENFLKAGDVLEVCGFVLKEGALQAPLAKPDDAHVQSSRPISGHLLVMPDGKRQFWADYGVIEKCLKPGESKEALREDSFRRR